MPESAPLFDEDEITDRSERFLAAELVREQLMRRVGDEVPYALTVQVERFEVDGAMLRIAAVVWVEREHHKPIVIGKGGVRFKAIACFDRRPIGNLYRRMVYREEQGQN